MAEWRDFLPTLRFPGLTLSLDLAESFPTDLEMVADLNLTVLSEWASLSSTLNLDSDTPRTCAVSLADAKRDLIRTFISEVYIDVPAISIALSRRF